MCLRIGALWGRWRWLCGLDRGGATQAAVARELYPAAVARAGRRLRGGVCHKGAALQTTPGGHCIALHCIARLAYMQSIVVYAEHTMHYANILCIALHRLVAA